MYTTKKIEINSYIDITKDFIKRSKPNNHKVLNKKYFKDSKGNIYKVDGKNVVLDYSQKEKETAIWLKKTFGGKIYMLPRVNNPKGIKTADYLWNNEKWDLKETTEKAISKTRAVDNIIKTAKNQTDNIILDITNTKLSKNNILKQVKKIYSTKGRNWVNKIMIIKNNELIKVYQSSRENLQ